jgi:hypothetical protein
MVRIPVTTVAFAAVLPLSPVLAEVTPEQVWANWQAMATAAGQELTVGAVAENGDALEATDIVVTFSDELGGSFSATIDRMAFADKGDGTVAVTMSDAIPLSFAFANVEDGPSALKFTVNQPGTVITASGTPEATNYIMASPSVALVLDEVTDETGQVLDTKGEVVLSDLSSSYTLAPDGTKSKLDGTLSAKSMVLDLSGTGADGSGGGSFKVTLTDLAGTSAGVLLGPEAMANMAAALNQGFSTKSSFSYGSMTVDFDVTDVSGPFQLTGTSGSGALAVEINKDRLAYSTSMKTASFNVSGAEIPFPEVVVTFAETGFDLQMPVTRSEAAQDYGFKTWLTDLTVSEDIWGLFDPGAVLSRDPASFVFNVNGKGFWTQDILDPEAQMDGTEPPGQLESLDLRELLLKAVGTEITATGGLTFDNTDLETFQGIPEPTGSFNVTIRGVNALIDNLISMGLLPDDQAMGFRMMLGMFTRPGAGGDEVTSLIEIRDGGIFANGQRLQ